MGYAMKPFPGFGNSPCKMDLTKKSGLGPRAKETDTVKYEQGNPLGIENPVALEKLYEKTEKPRQ
tara:strand:- start:394 stop:588 length:195 start_codon:yes stop_codon:yes gene_type:complete